MVEYSLDAVYETLEGIALDWGYDVGEIVKKYYANRSEFCRNLAGVEVRCLLFLLGYD